MLARSVLSLLVAWGLVAAVAPAAEAQQRPKVVIAQATDSLIFMVCYVARAKGYFAEEGLDQESTVYRGGVEAMAGLLSGSAQIYLGTPSSVMKVVDKGQELTVFGALLSQVPSNIVIQGDVAAKKGITASSSLDDKLKALRGLTMGINAPGSASDQVLRYTVRLAGLDPERDIKIVPVGGDAALIATFEQKRIDGFAWPSPASDLAVSKFGGLMVVNFAKGEFEPLRGFLYVSLIALPSWLKANPDTAAKVIRALGKAQKLIIEKPDEAKAAMKTFFPAMDAETFDMGFKANAAAIPPTPRIVQQSMQLNKDFSESVEGIKYKIEVGSVYTNEYVDLAEKR